MTSQRASSQSPIGPSLAVVGLILLFVGCGGSGGSTSDAGESTAATDKTGEMRALPPHRARRIRSAVLSGAARDFDAGVEIADADFRRCFLSEFRSDLDEEHLAHLYELERTEGRAAGARALNRFGLPAADRCGRREQVPELTSASERVADVVATTVPGPVRFAAPAIELTKCKGHDVRGGYDVRVAGLTCADADLVLSSFTTAFSDKNLRRELVDRGHGWRCYQRLYAGGSSVEETCWRGRQQVVIFKK